MNEIISRLLIIMSTFKPIKGVLTGVDIWYTELYYCIQIELDSTSYIDLTISTNIFSHEYNDIRQYVHDELNKELANTKDKE